MIARITNFTERENVIADWGVTRVSLVTLDKTKRNEDYVSSYSIKILEAMLNELNLLLEKYPDALKKEVVLEKYKQLKKYAMEHNTTLNACYSYCDRQNICYNQFYSYGIRMIPTNIDTSVQITRYGLFNDSFLFAKEELNLQLIQGELKYNNLIIGEQTSTDILDREALTYLKPNILTKHL